MRGEPRKDCKAGWETGTGAVFNIPRGTYVLALLTSFALTTSPGCIDDIYGCNVVGQRSGDYDVMDRSGHGTHCAGTIAAAQNNSIGERATVVMAQGGRGILQGGGGWKGIGD